MTGKQRLAGNVGVMSGIFFPKTADTPDMSAPCRRHDTDHVGDIVRFWHFECADIVVSACQLADMSAKKQQHNNQIDDGSGNNGGGGDGDSGNDDDNDDGDDGNDYNGDGE